MGNHCRAIGDRGDCRRVALRPIKLRLGGEDIHLVTSRDLERWGGFLNGRLHTLLVLVGVAACQSAAPSTIDLDLQTEWEWEGENIRFGAVPEDARVCGGTLAYLDSYFGALKRKFGAPDDLSLDYFYIGDENIDGLPCPESFVGCESASLGAVFAREVVLEHELVHAARVASSHAVIEEETAMVWGDDWLWTSEATSIRDALAAADGRELPPNDYGTAGHFVSFLANDYGSFDTFAAFADDTRYRDSTAELDAAANASYGHPMAELLRGYDGYRDENGWCPPFRYRDASLSCEVSAELPCSWRVAQDGVELFFDFEVDLSCASDDAIGPKGADYQGAGGGGVAWASRVIRPPIATGWVISVTAADDETLSLVDQGDILVEACSGGCSHRQKVFTLEETPSIVLVDMSDYRIRLRQYTSDPAAAVQRFRVRFSTTLADGVDLPAGCG